ncbi:MAG: helix-turn-helix transcriptional regulator [Clostridiaceae bacterium]|nr:helix-turn-helix transcriptional regulator [Clostridiaceae bacterium]
MNIGGRIKEKREKLGISQRELARRIDMSGQMISKIESGLSTPSIDTINKIAALLNVPAASLLEDYNEESFSYKLICAIEEAYKNKYNGYITHDIFQVLSDDLDIAYENFDNFQMKKTIYNTDSKGSNVYSHIANENLDRTIELPIDDIQKLLTYYSDLDNYKFRKLCSKVFYEDIDINTEVKNIVNKFAEDNNNGISSNLQSGSIDENLKSHNSSEYYKYLELRITELAGNSMITINTDKTNEIIKNIDSLIEFELHKLKTSVKDLHED